MPNLFVYGCSNSESFDTKVTWAIKYVKWKGFVPKCYGQLISEELKINLINYSKSGTNNHSIFQKICETIKNINEDDMVIVQWTDNSRFRLVNDLNEWVDFYPNSVDTIKNFENVSKETITELMVNRTNTKYFEELKSWELIIRQTLNKTKLVFWSPFKEFNSYHSLERIKTETNNEIDDNHLSENGHKEIYKILLENLNKHNLI